MKIEEFQSSFQFLGHRIVNMSISNDFIGWLEEDKIEKTFDVAYNNIDINCDEESKIGTIDLNVAVNILQHDGDDNQTKFDLLLVIQGCFIDNKDVSDKEFEEKLKLNGCASLYSIARGIITSISAQSVVTGQITLPMINVFKMLESSDAANK